MIYIPVILLALLLQVVWHELGHVLLARLFGDTGATFRLFPREDGKLTGLGLTITTKGFPFTPTQDMAIDLGGVGLSWLGALLLGHFLPYFWSVSDVFGAFWLTFYLLARLNLLVYALRDSLTEAGRARQPQMGDVSLFAHHWAEAQGISPLWGYGLCLGLGVLDLFFLPQQLQALF